MMRSPLIANILIRITGLLILGMVGFYFYKYLGSQNQKASPPPMRVGEIVDPQTQSWKDEFRAEAPMKRVVELYHSESQRIGAVDPSPSETQKRLEVFAAELNAQEMEWLKNQALNSDSEGDARFFAAYLLALNPVSVQELKNIASSAIPKSKNQGLVELERQIRAQAIEGISRRCGDKSAEEAILDIMQAQDDAFLQDRGHRSLYSWRTCKPIESQDKEALSKLQYGK